VTIGDYGAMLRIRLVEEALYRHKLAGDVVPNIHQCIGQEGVCVGAVGALRKSDYLTSNYRGRGHAIAKGAPIRGVIAEVMHRETGLARGRTGPMHMVDASCNLVFQSAIVGGAAPLAVGVALSAVRRGTDAVCMTIFGEGATAQGTVHEALNLAGAWSLPVVFVLENNRYSEMTPASATTALRDFSWRALGHGIPALSVDGNSVADTRAATNAAIEWARSGRGPAFIEAHTYRLVGHYGGDPGLYRPKGELDDALTHEPIARAERALLESGTPREELDAAREAIEAEVEDAVRFALDSPLSDPAGVGEHVYKERS
jgi:TPP-dependent pyruvate/acetoin dehydrogenase alpha subunit